MRVGVDARRALGLPCLPPRPPFPPPRSMPSRAGWCAGLAPSTHLATHVWRDWMSGATLCPRAGQAVGLTRRAASAPRDAGRRLPSRRPLTIECTPFPHTLGSPVGMCTRRDCGKIVSLAIGDSPGWAPSNLGHSRNHAGLGAKKNPKGCHTQDGDGHGKSGVTWRPSSHEQL